MVIHKLTARFGCLEGDTLERFRENCVEERRRFSWEEMCSRILELYDLVAAR